MTYEQMGVCLDSLQGLKFPPVDYSTHWLALQHHDVDALRSAVTVAAKECESFPAPAELLSIMSRTAPRVGVDEDRSLPLESARVITAGSLKIPVTREWRYYDDRCSDTGWAPWWCNGQHDLDEKHPLIVGATSRRSEWMDVASCGRDYQHLPHDYVTPCACSESNPAVQKARERQAQQAATRTAKREAA